MNDDYTSDTITLTNLGSTVTISPSITATNNSILSDSSIYLDDILEQTTITLGNTKINETQLKDLLTLLNVITELDDNNPVKELFNNTKMLDKIKGEKVV
jgi:hypothetical protein